jgi:hypothetical protein
VLSNVKTLKGYILKGKDGEMGSVKDIYFDDHNWAVRYLVADTGTWLMDRQVLISPHALIRVSPELECISVDLTKKQISDSPPLEMDLPVSSQFEESYHGYYGWPAYWGSSSLWGTLPRIINDPVEVSPPRGHAWDPHLRSALSIDGSHIQAKDGEIGHVYDFVLDDEHWAIRYMIVDTHNWWLGKKGIISPRWIDRVSWNESKVFLGLTCDAIEHSPEYREKVLLNKDYEIDLHEHYERKVYWEDNQIEKSK